MRPAIESENEAKKKSAKKKRPIREEIGRSNAHVRIV
jgi:hypothetical protein